MESRSESVARTCHELFEGSVWRIENFLCRECDILERALHCCTTASTVAMTEKEESQKGETLQAHISGVYEGIFVFSTPLDSCG